MKITIVLILIYFALLQSCASVNKSATLNCNTLDSCINDISKLEYSEYVISEDAITLAKKFHNFGEPALIKLLDLLESEDPMTLEVVGYALAEFTTIDPKHLPQIAIGVEKDIPRIMKVLGNISSDKAAKLALNTYIKRSSSPNSQEAHAVIQQGSRVLPYILSAANCNNDCKRKRMVPIINIIGDMDAPVQRMLAKQIIEILNIPSTSIKSKRSLIGLLFRMGEQGRIIEDQLNDLRTQSPILAPSIDYAFVGIKSKYSGRVFAEYLQTSPTITTLRNVSIVGPAAYDAGLQLVVLLSHSDRDIRLGAARALGYIQYREAESLLIPLMTEKGDVRLNWVAAKSLGMIARKSSIEPLENVSKTHWYPAVRNAAKQASEIIKTENKHPKNKFSYSFFKYQYFGLKSCKKLSLTQVFEDPARKLYSDSQAKDLEKLTYDANILSYGAADEDEQLEKDPEGIVNVDYYNMVEHSERVLRTPDIALKVKDGWFAGSDRGEWGGDLVFIPTEGKAIKILDFNVEDIYSFGSHLIALSGLAHMSMNNGMIHKIYRKGNEWHAEPWINLPGAPHTSWLVETGELLINTVDGGSVLLSTDGSLRMAPCED